MAGVELKGVRKVYPNGAEAIRGVDMQINDGELVVFVRPSGCGKSTLLRMAARQETVTGGEISIGDRLINDVSPSERDVAMVFQNYALYPHMTVRGNMSYGLKNRKIPRTKSTKSLKAPPKPCGFSTIWIANPTSCPVVSASGLRWGV